jgi:catechol 2,3-dioxygenase-like lactoylglutathione lyase family enzyme
MLTQITHAGVWVHDIDEALAFYVGKLGWEVRYDIREETWSWVVVAPPGSTAPELVLSVPGPPFMDEETAAHVRELVGAGALSGGIVATGDCRADYEALKARGVEFHQEPMEREYGIDAAFRDPSGNSWRMTERR